LDKIGQQEAKRKWQFRWFEFFLPCITYRWMLLFASKWRTNNNSIQRSFEWRLL